jgi:hypothetical protein
MCARTYHIYACGDKVEGMFFFCPDGSARGKKPCEDMDVAVWELAKNGPCRWCGKKPE